MTPREKYHRGNKRMLLIGLLLVALLALILAFDSPRKVETEQPYMGRETE